MPLLKRCQHSLLKQSLSSVLTIEHVSARLKHSLMHTVHFSYALCAAATYWSLEIRDVEQLDRLHYLPSTTFQVVLTCSRQSREDLS
jgi:hypothetical protein